MIRNFIRRRLRSHASCADTLPRMSRDTDNFGDGDKATVYAAEFLFQYLDKIEAEKRKTIERLSPDDRRRIMVDLALTRFLSAAREQLRQRPEAAELALTMLAFQQSMTVYEMISAAEAGEQPRRDRDERDLRKRRQHEAVRKAAARLSLPSDLAKARHLKHIAKKRGAKLPRHFPRSASVRTLRRILTDSVK